MSLSAFLSLLLFCFQHVSFWNKFISFLKLQMDDSAGIEAEYHHKNNRVSFGSLGLTQVHTHTHIYVGIYFDIHACKHTCGFIGLFIINDTEVVMTCLWKLLNLGKTVIMNLNEFKNFSLYWHFYVNSALSVI